MTRPGATCWTPDRPKALGQTARPTGPFFVIQGRADNRTPLAAARASADWVRAPAKGYSEIDGGHFACFTNPTGLLDALVRDLRRLFLA